MKSHVIPEASGSVSQTILELLVFGSLIFSAITVMISHPANSKNTELRVN